MAYLFVPFPMTLDDLEGHSPNAGLIKCNSTNICATFSTVLTVTARRAVPRRQLSFLSMIWEYIFTRIEMSLQQRLRAALTVRTVFLSMTKMPRTVNPIGSPHRRLRNTFNCERTYSKTIRCSARPRPDKRNVNHRSRVCSSVRSIFLLTLMPVTHYVPAILFDSRYTCFTQKQATVYTNLHLYALHGLLTSVEFLISQVKGVPMKIIMGCFGTSITGSRSVQWLRLRDIMIDTSLKSFDNIPLSIVEHSNSGKKFRFDSIRFSLPNRFFSIRFANLINLPLLH